MKKRFRKLAEILLALALLLSFPVSALAAETGTITVSVPGDNEFIGKEVTAVQMFSATTNGTGGVAYTLDADFEDFFLSDNKYGCTGKTGVALSDAAYTYVSNLGIDEAAEVIEFAKEALAWVKAHSSITGTTATADSLGTATFSNMEYGYYLIYPETGSTDATRHTVAQLVNLTGDTSAVNLKSEYTSVDKQIIDGDTTDAIDVMIGDTVTYTLASKVPDMTDYSTYTFRFIDTLSAGLTYGSITSVTVGGTALTETTEYTAATAVNVADETKTDLTITLLDFYANYQAEAGAAIVVTYTATLNENAVVGTAGNANSVVVEYSNDPGDPVSTGTSTPDKVRTYTFGFTIDKYTGETYDAGATRLPGAVFELKSENTEAADAIDLVQVSAGSDTDPAVYRVAKADDPVTVTSMTTPDSGLVDIDGLEEGTYYLFETTAPNGYNRLASSISINIDATYSTLLDSVTITYNGTDATDGVVPVQNNTGSLLPTTGGIGTTLFTVGGVALVIIGGVWLVIRKKKKDRA